MSNKSDPTPIPREAVMKVSANYGGKALGYCFVCLSFWLLRVLD